MKSVLPIALALLAALPTTSCGSLLFPERHSQEHSGKLDPNIVVLDAIGLAFFILPGLIAFAVDFTKGTIYLPVGMERGEGPFFHDSDGDSEE